MRSPSELSLVAFRRLQPDARPRCQKNVSPAERDTQACSLVYSIRKQLVLDDGIRRGIASVVPATSLQASWTPKRETYTNGVVIHNDVAHPAGEPLPGRFT